MESRSPLADLAPSVASMDKKMTKTSEQDTQEGESMLDPSTGEPPGCDVLFPVPYDAISRNTARTSLETVSKHAVPFALSNKHH